jgi:hypothetical protein
MATELSHNRCLDDALAIVRAMLRRGAPFEHIEAFIVNAGLDREQESVLWLYAWCGGQAHELREIVTASEPATT